MSEDVRRVIDYFEIPEDIAKELSDVMVKHSIRESILLKLVNDKEKYEAAEANLIPITARLEALKIQITRDYVPKKYNSRKFIWNYNGFDVDGNRVQIITEEPNNIVSING